MKSNLKITNRKEGSMRLKLIALVLVGLLLPLAAACEAPEEQEEESVL